jgi:hypothetical protein
MLTVRQRFVDLPEEGETRGQEEQEEQEEQERDEVTG